MKKVSYDGDGMFNRSHTAFVQPISHDLPSRDVVTVADDRGILFDRLFHSNRFAFSVFNRAGTVRRAVEIAATLVLGLALGGILVFTRGLSSEWKGLVILATITPTIALLTNNMNKLLLIALVIDMPLGLDISLVRRLGSHKGGPPGFTISLMTIVLVVGYALWLTKRPRGGNGRVYTHKDITIPALVYFFVMLVSFFQSTEMWFSITELFLQVQFLLIYFYLINHIKTWSSVRLIITTLVICLLLESLVMLAQYYTGFQLSALGINTQIGGSDIESATARVGGTFGGANTAATFLATSLAITFAACLVRNRLVNNKLAYVSLLLGIGALATTQSRSAMAAFGVALLIIGAQALRMRLGTRAFLVFFILVAVLALGFSVQLVERFTNSGEESALTRVWHTKLAFNILDDYLFTGVGLSNSWFVIRTGDYLPEEMLGKKLNILHNKYLTIWVETGLFGFLAFIWLLLATGKRALFALTHTKDRYTSIAVTGLLAALVVYSWHMTTATFSGRVRMQLLWLIVALIAATSQLAKNPERLKDPILQPNEPTKARPIMPPDPQLLDSSHLVGES